MNTLAFPIEGLISADGLTQLLAKYITQSGVVEPNALKVEPLPSPDMKLRISGSTNDDHLVILKPSGGYLVGWNLEPFDIDIAPNITGVTKTDAVVAYFDLTAGDDATPEAPNGLSFMVVRRPLAETGTVLDTQIDTEVGHSFWHRLSNQPVTHNATSISGGTVDTRQRAWLGAELLAGGSITADKIAAQSWSAWTPTIAAPGSTTITSPTILRAASRRVGNDVSFSVVATFTIATATTAYITLTMPHNRASSAAFEMAAPVSLVDTAVGMGFAIWGDASNNTIRVYKSDASNWATGSGRIIRLSGTYEAAT